MQALVKKPSWLKKNISLNNEFLEVKSRVERIGLHTVCREASCPNLYECWSQFDFTFLILGKECTRRCRFCNISSQNPSSPDPTEPERVCALVKNFNLDYVLITSVTRDDLPDYGCKHFIQTIREIKNTTPETIVEVLIPDFFGRKDLIKEIATSGCEVIGHNIETVPRLYHDIRGLADYERSLDLLSYIKNIQKDVVTKSSLMVGLGEIEEEIIEAIRDLKYRGVDILYIGQYLQPSRKHFPVMKFYPPCDFKKFELIASSLGFSVVRSGPLMRSSYKARDAYFDFLSNKL